MKRELFRFARAMDEVRKLDKEMPIQMALAFVRVALNEGQPMKFYADELEMSQSSFSRNAMALGAQHRNGKEGLELIYTEEDSIERRRKVVRLTARGKRIAADIAAVMADRQ